MWDDLRDILTQCMKRLERKRSQSDIINSNFPPPSPEDDMVQWLTHEVPVEKEGKLVFEPRIVQLPNSTQKDAISWFLQHLYSVPNKDTLDLLQAYQTNQPTDAWVRQLVNILENKISPGAKPVYTFTRQTLEAHSGLIEECKRGGRRDVLNPWRKLVNTPASLQTAKDSQDGRSEDMEGVSMVESSQATQSSHTPEDAPLDGKTELPEKIRLQIDELVEIWKSAESVSVDVPPQVKCFVDCTPAQFEDVCQRLSFDSLSEPSLSASCLHVVSLGSHLSHHNTVLIARACLLPRVVSLAQNPSRTLIAAVKTFFEVYPNATIDGLLVPSLSSPSTAAPQADVTSRVIKEDMTSQNRHYFFSKLVSIQQKWTDPLLVVIQTLVDLKTDIDEPLLSEIVERLGQVEGSDSPKLAKLILAIIQKYGKMITVSHGSELKLILQKNTSFVRKPALAALNKLKLGLKG